MPFARFTWGVLGANLFVILWGALVRATGSGAGCGRHWPLCNGEVIPESHATRTLIEFTHRVTSGAALLLVVGVFWWARRAFPPEHRARRAASWALGLICIEALVGAGLVLLRLVGENASPARAAYLAFHLLNTFLLIGSIALTAHWAVHPEPWRQPATGPARWLLGAGLALVLVLGMSGAIAALGGTLYPVGSLAAGLRADVSPTADLLVRLRVLHPVLALPAGAYLSAMVWRVIRARPTSGESPWARAVTILVLAQLGVGITNLLLHAPTLLQLAHLLVADLLWIATVLFLATALAAAPAGRPGEAMEATPAGSGAGG
jgi:heme A synthase